MRIRAFARKGVGLRAFEERVYVVRVRPFRVDGLGSRPLAQLPKRVVGQVWPDLRR